MTIKLEQAEHQIHDLISSAIVNLKKAHKLGTQLGKKGLLEENQSLGTFESPTGDSVTLVYRGGKVVWHTNMWGA